MWSSHRNVERVSGELQIPRRTQRDLACRAGLKILTRLFACAGDCLNVARLQINAPNQMVFGIGDVERVAGKRESLWAMKRRLIEAAVRRADFAGADSVHQCAVEFGNYDSIVIRVGDEESIGCGVSHNLSWESER